MRLHKQKIIITAFSIIMLTIFGCSADKTHYVEIKLEKDTKRIIVPITFNGVTSDFLFDTGCDKTTVQSHNDDDSTKRSKALQLRYLSDTAVNYYPKGKFCLGPFQSQNSFIVNESTNNTLGMDFISKYYWYIDLDKGIAQISNSPIENLGKESFGFDYYPDIGGTMMVDLPTNSKNKFSMLFDTGASIFCDMLLFKERDSIDDKKWRSKESDLFIQRNSDKINWFSESMHINSYIIRYLILIFENDTQRIRRFNKRGVDGIVSIDFVHRYKKLYIDPKKKKILFYGENKESENYAKNNFNNLRELIKRATPSETENKAEASSFLRELSKHLTPIE